MIKYIILILLLVLSIYNDLKFSKIRNTQVLYAVIAGFLINLYMFGMNGIISSTLGIIVPILLLGIFFYARLLGAGDIKLFAAIGALFGWNFVIYTMAYSFVFAGIITLFTIMDKMSLKSMFYNFFRDLKICCFTYNISYLQSNKRHIIKLSPAIAIGAVVQLLLNL